MVVVIKNCEKIYCSEHCVSDKDIFDNKLIFGDNLLALKVLEEEYSGKVKCVYIDPPYNPGNVYRHYDDREKHSLWLLGMRNRLELLYKFLTDDGSLWLQLNDIEVHYVKVLCDEIFGRDNFVASIVWKRRATQANFSKFVASVHDYILFYAKDISRLSVNRVSLGKKAKLMYKNPDKDPRGPWRTKPLLQGKKSRNVAWSLTAPDGRIITNRWRYSPEVYKRHFEDNRVYFPPGGQPNIKIFLSENPGRIPNTFWDGFGTNEVACREMEKLFGSQSAFDTPKPEALIERILVIATNPGDLVLDSYAGSGTTGAVAHKMGRRWIMIENGEHCYTCCIPRLKKVIGGEDEGGISEKANWQGGGGFQFYILDEQ